MNTGNDGSDEDAVNAWNARVAANAGTDIITDKSVSEKQRQELIHKLRQEIENCQETIDEHQSRIRSAIVRIRKERLSQVVPTPAVRKQVEAMGPMDDPFFNKMAEDKAAIGEVISTIMGVEISVEEAIPQYYITNLCGRSVQLDSFAILEKNTNFRDLPRAVVIFISSFDVFNKGKMIYKTRLVAGEDNSIEVRRPVTEYYVNTKITESDTPYKKKVSKLMKLFSDPDEYDFQEFPYFSQQKNELKNTKEGREDMSKELQEFVDEREKKAAAEEKRKTTIEHIHDIMHNLKLTVEQAMDALSIPQDQRTMYAGLVKNS